MHPEDREILDRLKRGDPEIIKLIEGWIRSVVKSFWRLAAEEEDVAQACLMKVIKSLERGGFLGEDGARLKAYLRRAAKNTCLDWKLPPAEAIDCNDSAVSPAVSAERIILTRELVEHLRKETSPDCWKMFVMVDAGFTRWEMGQELGISEKAVRQKLLRCRKRAAGAYQQFAGENPQVSVTFS